MPNFRPEFIPEVPDAQRLTQVIALGDIVRGEGSGVWWIGDGVTLGGVSGGPPTQAALATLLTTTDVYAQDGVTTTPNLAQQLSDNTTAMRSLITGLYQMFGEDFIQGRESLVPYIIESTDTF